MPHQRPLSSIMTLKNSKKSSIEGDKYYTPDWCVRQCIDLVIPLLVPQPKTILEPAAGLGAFVAPLRAAYPGAVIHANDIDPLVGSWASADVSLHLDFLKIGVSPLHNGARYDLIVGNPPFTFAQDFVSKSLQLADSVLFILRQGFMSSAERARFFRETKPVLVRNIPCRPSFTPDGETDSADYCWIGWRRGYTGRTDLDWLPEVPKSLRLPPYFPPEAVAAALTAKAERDESRKLRKQAEKEVLQRPMQAKAGDV